MEKRSAVIDIKSELTNCLGLQMNKTQKGFDFQLLSNTNPMPSIPLLLQHVAGARRQQVMSHTFRSPHGPVQLAASNPSESEAKGVQKTQQHVVG